jgi:uncharacterized membrane protein
MTNKIKLITVTAVLSLLSACGGGGGGGTTTPSNTVTENPDVITGVVLNPSLAVQRVYQFSGNTTSGQYKYQYSQGPNETINGTIFNVQNLVTIDAAGNAVTTKRYYTNTPFRIYIPPTVYNSDGNYQEVVAGTVDAYYKILYAITNTFSLGELPTSAKVGDFGTYITSSSQACNIKINVGTCFNLPGVLSSSWTLEKYDQSTAGLCFGSENQPRLPMKVCYRINLSNQAIN